MSRLPTLVGPLVAGTEHVRLEGMTPLLPVYLEVDIGGPIPVTVQGVPTSYELTLPLILLLGSRVRVASVLVPPKASPDPPGPWHEVLEPADVPGVAVRAPVLPPYVDPAARAVLVLGAYPGALVQIRQVIAGGGITTFDGIAGPDGRACVRIDPAIGSLTAASDLEVRQRLWNSFGPWKTWTMWKSAPLLQELSVAVSSGQAGLRVQNTTAGSQIDVSTQSGAAGTAWACSETTDVALSRPILPTDDVLVTEFFTGRGFGPPLTVPTTEQRAPAPEIVGPLYAGATGITIHGLVPGMHLTVTVTALLGFPPLVRYEPAPVSFGEWVELPQPLPAQIPGLDPPTVSISWYMGTLPAPWSFGGSLPVPVQDLPAGLRDLTIVPNPFPCGLMMGVLTTPGAEVIVEEDGGFVGYGRVTSELGHVAAPTVPLVGGRPMVAREILPGAERESPVGLRRVPLVIDNFGDADPFLFPPPLFPLGTPGGPAPTHNNLGHRNGGVALSAATVEVLRKSNDLTSGLLLAPRASGATYTSILARAGPGPSPVRSVAATDHLAFRGGVSDPVGVAVPVPASVDLLVALEDTAGNTGTVRIGALHPLPSRRLYPGDDVAGQVPQNIRGVHEVVPLVSVSLPLDAFVATYPTFELGSLDRLVLGGWSRADLSLWIDDVEMITP